MKVFLQHKWVIFSLICGLIIVALLRVIATYNVFWQTWDEPAHIAAGMEWLDQGQYTYELFHPPLARVMTALGPYIQGLRSFSSPDMWQEGNAILHTNATYEQNLTWARLGTLPFLIVAAVTVGCWASRCGGQLGAIAAVLLFTTLPTVLGHAGLATLDMAAAALTTLALFAVVLWLAKPNLWRSLLLGIAAGLATLTKFSALGFIVLGAGLMILVHSYGQWQQARTGVKSTNKLPTVQRLRQGIGQLIQVVWQRRGAIALIFLLGAITIWAGYRFSFEPILTARDIDPEKIEALLGEGGGIKAQVFGLLRNVPVPAPEFLIGLAQFLRRNGSGQPGYLLGDLQTHGWWYFYLVLLPLKTPLAFWFLSALSLGLVGYTLTHRPQGWEERDRQILLPLVAAIGIVALASLGSVHNGLRQILAVYPLLAIVAGAGIARVMALKQPLRKIGSGAAIALLTWQVVASAYAYPDYLTYFNELVQQHPSEIMVESDVDWGQDLKRLVATLKERNIDNLALIYNGSNGLSLEQFDLPSTQPLIPYEPTTGWVAISVRNLEIGTGEVPFDQFSWLQNYQPIEEIGNSIFLYYIEP
ncbi:MAG: hypothetical protein AAGF24_02960 [Cyanobacteria bacterium P01_H01_bin.121]